MRELILASTSSYRKILLQKFKIPFETKAPLLDEELLKHQLLKSGSSPRELSSHLAKSKAESLRDKSPSNALIIGSDQVVVFKNKILGKPHTHQNAVLQLLELNNNTHSLLTSICLVSNDILIEHTDITEITLHHLTPVEIENYLRIDRPYDCAGSYKIESHGVTLFKNIKCNDFSAVEGLPLIWLASQLRNLGYEFYKYGDVKNSN